MAAQPEKVFEVLAEGGSLCITRKTVNGKPVYLYKHQEGYDDLPELSINKQLEFPDFDQPFRLLNNYPWPMLYLHIVHPVYREFVLEKLIEKLNETVCKIPDL